MWITGSTIGHAGSVEFAGGDLVLRPTVADFIDVAHLERTGLQLEEVLVPEHSPLIGKSIQEAAVGDAGGATVMAIQRSGGQWVNTSESATLATTPIQARNVLIAVGTGADRCLASGYCEVLEDICTPCQPRPLPAARLRDGISSLTR